MKSRPTVHANRESLFLGIYTLPDAARILELPLAKLRRWVGSAAKVAGVAVCEDSTPYGLSNQGVYGAGIEKHLDFLALIELFTIYQLREAGVSFPEIRAARSDLMQEFQTTHPFALKGLLSDGRKIATELKDSSQYLILNDQGQRGFEAVLKHFFLHIDFEQASQLAERYYPCGKEASVVVDPRISFGRPTVTGTAIATETLQSLFNGGETPEIIAGQFEISEKAVRDALAFESRRAA